MPNQQPSITDLRGRRFACSAAAILIFLVNDQHEILLLTDPQHPECWAVVGGAIEAEETIVAAALRETREELGTAAQVRPLGTVHAATFRYDETVQYMISICYLLAYEGGDLHPGDDAAGCTYRWWSLADLEHQQPMITVPAQQAWIFRRAIELYPLWKDQAVDLQPAVAALE